MDCATADYGRLPQDYSPASTLIVQHVISLHDIISGNGGATTASACSTATEIEVWVRLQSKPQKSWFDVPGPGRSRVLACIRQLPDSCSIKEHRENLG